MSSCILKLRRSSIRPAPKPGPRPASCSGRRTSNRIVVRPVADTTIDVVDPDGTPTSAEIEIQRDG
jgi:hypothetical protein